jgi:hypothetical protein
MCSVRRPFTWHWLVLVLLSVLVAFSFAFLVAAQEAQAKGQSDGGGGGGGDRSGGGGDSGGGDPIGDAVGGATKQLDGGGDGGGDRTQGGDLLNKGDTGGGGATSEGPLLSAPPLAADEPKTAPADTKPVTEKASGDLLNQVSGKATDRVPSGEPILKKDSPTTDLAPALAPAVRDTKDALEGVARPVSGEPVPTTSETIRPLVEGTAPATPTTKATEPLLDEAERLTTQQPAALVEEAPQLVDSALEGATKPTGAPLVGTVDDLTSPIADRLDEATQQPLRIVDGAVTPVREALGPALGNTAEPLLKRAEPLLEPGIGPVLGKVAPTVPLEGTPAAPTPGEQSIPAAELYAPVSGGTPALSPTTGSEPGTAAAAFEPAEASVSAPLFEPSVAVGEGASLPVLQQATQAPATTLPLTVSSSVLGATEHAAITPSPAPNHAAGSAAAASGEIPASVVSPAIDARDDAREEVGTVPGKISYQWVAPLGITGLGTAPTSWAEGFLVDDPSPFSPSSLPIAGSAFGGSATSGSGLGLGLLGALALILSLTRVNTLLRSARETFSASSYLQLAIERPG